MKSRILKYVIFFIFFSSYELKSIFMSTSGNDDSGDGSIENPYLSLMKCQEEASRGDIVYIRGGTYTNFDISLISSTYNYIHFFTKSGITYMSYNSEEVIFDFEFDTKYNKKDGILRQRVAGFMINEGTEDLVFENFACTRIPTLTWDEIVAAKMSKNLTQSECFQSRGKNIRFNRIKAYNNYGIGFYFVGLKSYNIAYRCDSYNNSGIDSAIKGNADGFGAHGTGAEFIECRAWDNSDDNYDCINSYGRTIFDKCWAFTVNFKNTDIQDGNGFKVGGWGKSADAKKLYGPYSGENPPVHIVKNCLAAKNKANGFYCNHQPGQAAVWYNNRAFNNKANFDMTEGSETWELDEKGKVKDICGTREVLYFNFGHKYNTKLKTDCNMYGTEANLFSAVIPDENNKFNSWNFRDITLSDDDFLSLDFKELANERGEDGSLPEVNFMKLNPNGPNYAILKTIEEEMQHYEIQDDGTIVNLNTKNEGEEEEEEEEKEEKEEKEEEIEEEVTQKDNDDQESKDKKENENLKDDRYYFDIDLNKYVLCSQKFQNCEKCSVENNNNFYCKNCVDGFTFKHNEGIQCSEQISLQQDKKFFTNDSGINYYSCSLYNNINNCLECSKVDKCDKCQNNYNLFNDQTLCVLQSDFESKIYNYNNDGLLKLCSSMINSCNRCNNSTSCFECQTESGLLYNNTCLSKKIIEDENNYYKDDITNKYISCATLDNCVKCLSKTICTHCQEGFVINNNICEKIKDSDNNLSTGAIVGIIVGCLVFLLLVAGLVYYLLKKKIANKIIVDNGNAPEKVEMTDEKMKKENEKENGNRTEKNPVMIHTIKRAINN